MTIANPKRTPLDNHDFMIFSFTAAGPRPSSSAGNTVVRTGFGLSRGFQIWQTKLLVESVEELENRRLIAVRSCSRPFRSEARLDIDPDPALLFVDSHRQDRPLLFTKARGFRGDLPGFPIDVDQITLLLEDFHSCTLDPLNWQEIAP